jgi:hypothetical protein
MEKCDHRTSSVWMFAELLPGWVGTQNWGRRKVLLLQTRYCRQNHQHQTTHIPERRTLIMDPDDILDQARDYRLDAQTRLDAYEALDGWVTRGGYLPAEWPPYVMRANYRHTTNVEGP